MEPVFVDIHIHTSEDADKVNTNYDVKALYDGIIKISKDKPVLVSLSDHNTINKSAYLKLKKFFKNIIIGVELHIRNYPEAPPYHAHILFNNEVNEQEIDKLNEILNVLYPTKIVNNTDHSIPYLEKIVHSFEHYDFLLLPHGGQSHSTFNCSIPKGVVFDTAMERSVYYNQFDGFTARGPEGTEKTEEYFKRLGIVEFINLITCSDNYNPAKYPLPKDVKASAFTPTWMLAEPTFEGLRISLSEKTRLIRSNDIPDQYQRCLKTVVLKNDRIDLEIEFLPGLNVVIGSSSTGKTLLVDSVYRSIKNDWGDSAYKEFKVENLQIENSAQQVPHYIYQTYITGLFANKGKCIGDMDILRELFPSQEDLEKKIEQSKESVKRLVADFFTTVSEIKEIEDKISKIPIPTELFHDSSKRANAISSLFPSIEMHEKCNFSIVDYDKFLSNLDEIEARIKSNPFTKDITNNFVEIKRELKLMRDFSEKEKFIYEILRIEKNNLDTQNEKLNQETRSKISDYEKLMEFIKSYKQKLVLFDDILNKITTLFHDHETKTRKVGEYTLSVEYSMVVDKDVFVESANDLFTNETKIYDFQAIKPQDFFLDRMRKTLHTKRNYSSISSQISDEFLKRNEKKYKIIAENKENFEQMSPGKKSSIILDLILGYTDDTAPIIIDQPEDNLSKDYMTTKMIDSILEAKKNKQIIFVTHTASIPMLGDAQNVILCQNEGGKLIIRSAPLEGKINGIKVVDHVVKLTDGGKTSVKKRFKKYNMKSFIGE